MGETANKARMAEIISKEIFAVFGWIKTGTMNHNWKCVIPTHGKSTHPSDVVFRYMDPYEGKTVYLNCDLKSYARKSITKYSMIEALCSLAKSTECMQFSDEWQDAYLQPGDNADKRGLLFVYNHDGDYDVNFKDLISSAETDKLKLRKGNKMHYLGPWDVAYLKTVANDIETLRGRKVIPDDDKCTFYYPDLIKRKTISSVKLAASIEMLLGPWQILKFSDNGKTGLIIYYKSNGETVDEFLHLIDFIANYQLLQAELSINIRLPNASRAAIGNFEKSVSEYARIQQHASLGERLGRIKFESVTNIVTRFSDIEIGMED